MDNNLMYIPNDNKQNYPFYNRKLNEYLPVWHTLKFKDIKYQTKLVTK